MVVGVGGWVGELVGGLVGWLIVAGGEIPQDGFHRVSPMLD